MVDKDVNFKKVLIFRSLFVSQITKINFGNAHLGKLQWNWHLPHRSNYSFYSILTELKIIVPVQVDKERVANIIAQALQKQTNGEAGEQSEAGPALSRPESQADNTSTSRPNSIHEPLPLPPRPAKESR